MEKQILSTKEAPAAIGPYSQGVLAKGFLFVSGQLALDPESGEFVTGDIQAQTRQVIENVRAVARAAGAGLEQTVKTTIYLADISDFAAVNETYGQYFNQDPPARAVIQAAALPKNARIEMEAVIACPDSLKK